MLMRRAYNKGAFVHLFIFHLLISSYTHTHTHTRTHKSSLRNFHFHIFDISYFQRIAYFSLSYSEKFILQTTFPQTPEYLNVTCWFPKSDSASRQCQIYILFSSPVIPFFGQSYLPAEQEGERDGDSATSALHDSHQKHWEPLSSRADLYQLQTFSFSSPSLQYTGSSYFFLFLISWGWALRSVLHGKSTDLSMTFASWELR